MAYSGYTPNTAYTRADDLITPRNLDDSALQQLMALAGGERRALPVSNILRWMGSRPQASLSPAPQQQRQMPQEDNRMDIQAAQRQALDMEALAAKRRAPEMVGSFVAPVGGVMNSIGGYVQATGGTPGARASGWVDRRDRYAPSDSRFAGPMGPSRASLGPDSGGQLQPSSGGPTSFKLSPAEIADFSRQNYGYGRLGVTTNVAQGADYSGKGQGSQPDDDEAVQELINLYRSGGRAR